jgi:hypothetical protein
MHPAVSAEFRRRVKRLAMVFEADAEDFEAEDFSADKLFDGFIDMIKMVSEETIHDLTSKRLHLEDDFKM